MSPTLRKWTIRCVVPYAASWVAKQERRILEEGRELTGEERDWASRVGVRNAEKVRVLNVASVPLPGAPFVHFVAGLFRYPLSPIGLAAQYGIYLNQRSKNDPSLLVHELVHVAQYERFGGIRPFLVQYLEECLRDGYWEASMECEARVAAIPFNRPPDR